MPMHLLKEKDLKDICLYCGKEHPDSMEWKSEWCSHIHYKSGKCLNCGKNLRLQVHFEGSGHDLWHKIKDHEWDNRKHASELIKKMGK
jgi:hypothetical protein